MKRVLTLTLGFCLWLTVGIPAVAQSPAQPTDQFTMCSFTQVGQTCTLANPYGAQTAVLQVNGGNATLIIEGSLDNSNFVQVSNLTQSGTTNTVISPIVLSNLSLPIAITGSIAGFPYVRVRVASFTSVVTAFLRLTTAGTGGGTTSGSVTVTNTVSTTCSNCLLPFNGTTDANAAASNQGLAIFGFNGTTFDRVKSILGALQVVDQNLKKVYCAAATVGGHTLACVDQTNTNTCVNNSGADSCTITGTNYFASCFNESGTSQGTVQIDVYDSSAAAPAAYTHIVQASSTQPLGPNQVLSPAYGRPVVATNITILISGSGTSQPFSCYYE